MITPATLLLFVPLIATVAVSCGTEWLGVVMAMCGVAEAKPLSPALKALQPLELAARSQ